MSSDNPGEWWEAQAKAEAEAEAALKAEKPPAKAPAMKPDATPAEAPAGVAGLDAEEAAELKDLLARKVRSPEELQRHHGLTDEQVAALTAKPASRASIEKEIADLRALKQSDPRRYWSAEIQTAELELLKKLEGAKADKAAAEAPDASDDLDAPNLPPEVAEEWKASIGLQRGLKTARATVATALDALEEDAAAALEASFDAELPPAIQVAAYRHLGLDGGGHTKPVSEQQLAAFSGIGDEAAQLVKGWGGKAGSKLGQAYNRLELIISELGEEDAAKAHAWLGSRTPAERAAIIRAMAR
jgi:hypothetical protein